MNTRTAVTVSILRKKGQVRFSKSKRTPEWVLKNGRIGTGKPGSNGTKSFHQSYPWLTKIDKEATFQTVVEPFIRRCFFYQFLFILNITK